MIWSEDEDTGVYDLPLRAPALPAAAYVYDTVPEEDTAPHVLADAVPDVIEREITRPYVFPRTRVVLEVV